MEAVRRSSPKTQTQEMADRPREFLETRQPATEYLFVPCVSSGRRPYVPMAILPAETIIRTPSFAVENHTSIAFGQLQSSMFMAWVRVVSGRFKSDYQITPGIVYNTFPFLEPDDARKSDVEQAV